MKIQSLLVMLYSIAVIHAQTPAADPFRATLPDGSPVPEGPINISLCLETFSLPMAAAAKLQREALSDPALYERILEMGEKNGVKQETFTMLRGKSGQKSHTEGISEEIYATEYEPPELPNAVGVALSANDPDQPAPVTPPGQTPVQPPVKIPDAAGLPSAASSEKFSGLKTPALPTSFETRNVGITFEAEPTLADNEKVLDLRAVPEWVTYVGRSAWGQDLSKVEMPVFETQRINTSINMRMGQPALLGTFNRPPVSKVSPDSANRVWFAFVTATIVRP